MPWLACDKYVKEFIVMFSVVLYAMKGTLGLLNEFKFQFTIYF